MTKYLACDIETTSLDPRIGEIVGIAMYDGTIGTYYTDLNEIRDILEDESIDKIWHNSCFDLGWLQYKGYVVKGQQHDTMILSSLLDPDRPSLKLKDLSAEILGEASIAHARTLYEFLKQNGLTHADISKAPQDMLKDYAIEDVRNTYNLFKHFCGKMRDLKKWLNERGFNYTPWDYYLAECLPLIPVIVDMENKGVKIDLEQTAHKQLALGQRAQLLKGELNEVNKGPIKALEELLYRDRVADRCKKNKTGKLKKEPPRITFNWDSSAHLKKLFFQYFKETPKKTTYKGNVSIDGAVLQGLQGKYSWISRLLEYKELKKLTSTYLDNLISMQIGGRIYARFNITGTATGRLSSSGPNLQNIPKHGGIKELFIPAKGHKFIYADYSQLELRLAAHLSQDEQLLEAYTRGADLHQITADTIGVSRDLAKTVNFAIIYNASGWRLKEILGLKTAEEGDKIKEKLFKKYKGLKVYLDKQVKQMLRYGMAISEFGRIRRLRGLKSNDRKEYGHAIKAGFNMPIQSMGASLCKRAMVILRNKGYSIANQIHDSIIIEVANEQSEDALAEIKSTMEGIAILSVPLLVEPKILDSFEEK